MKHERLGTNESLAHKKVGDQQRRRFEASHKQVPYKGKSFLGRLLHVLDLASIPSKVEVALRRELPWRQDLRLGQLWLRLRLRLWRRYVGLVVGLVVGLNHHWWHHWWTRGLNCN